MDHVSRLSHWLANAAGGVGSAAQGAASPSRDWALWREACGGNPGSATQLVRELTPQAYGLAIQLVGKREDAQDAVQDAFLRLWRSSPTDTHGARLATYFNTIVINCCRSLMSSRREQPTERDALIDLHDAQQLREGSTGSVLPAADAGGGSQARLHQGLRLLPVRQRMAIAMWTYADASVADIARTLEIDPNAAHQLLHRAKLALRAHLDGGLS
jgi:RNA polymerase sigma-70 factor, ECF subfamily